MEFLDLVKQRYSCRNYQEKGVEQEILDYVMECVRFALSAEKCKQLFAVGDNPCRTVAAMFQTWLAHNK